MASAGRGINFECPNCNIKLVTKQGDWSWKHNGFKRRRWCPKCNYRCTTIEKIVAEQKGLPRGFEK